MPHGVKFWFIGHGPYRDPDLSAQPVFSAALFQPVAERRLGGGRMIPQAQAPLRQGVALGRFDEERRAEAVASVLRSNGVTDGRIRTYGAGEDQPIASNLNAAGRAQNRRVEVVILPTQNG